MTIGILTYHRSHNYGTMLQAIALRRAIADMGHVAVFLDYWPWHQRKLYALFSWTTFRRGGLLDRFRYLKRFLLTLVPKLFRRRRFNSFFRKEIKPYCRNPFDEFDVVVFGSDQIWRKQLVGGAFNPIYFGCDSFQTSWRVAYAASMGDVPTNPDDCELVKNWLGHLDRISVRESDVQEFLSKSGFQSVFKAVDPVFLDTPESWEEKSSGPPLVSSSYLLFYDLQSSCVDRSSLDRFAENHRLTIVRIVGTADSLPTATKRSTDGPLEFLNLVRNAACVVTSSFHGMAFSILFHKPFYACFRSKTSRAVSLLNDVGLSHQLISPKEPIPEEIPEIDWQNVDVRIERLRNQSIQWLRSTIELAPCVPGRRDCP